MICIIGKSFLFCGISGVIGLFSMLYVVSVEEMSGSSCMSLVIYYP